MQDFLRWLASWKGIPVEPGTELSLELTGFPSGGLGLLVLLGIAAAVFVVVFAYRRDAHKLSPTRRFVLATLRALAILVTCALLLEPNIVAVKRDVQPGHTLVLLDVSQSMGHRDTYREPGVARLAADWRSLGVTDLASTERIELVKSVLGRDDQALLTSMAERNRVHVFGFANGLVPLAVLDRVSRHRATSAPATTDEDVQEFAQSLDLDAIVADGNYSNIEGAVRGALERSRDANIAGIVLLSDGRRNLGGQGPEIARLLRGRKVPHTIVLPIGDPSATKTLQLTRVEAPEKVFQKDPFTVRANLESQGYEDVTVPVRLKLQNEAGEDIETVRNLQVRLGTDLPETLVEFDGLESSTPGLFTYVIEVDPPDTEAASPERHVQRAQIEVLGEQTRVLLLAGGPSHEYRVLRRLLERDKTIELACWLQSADSKFSQDGNIHLEELPTEREELEKFDVFIFMDPDSKQLDATLCELLATLVREDGAGLWWVCGEKYTLDALREDATTRELTELLPVIIDMQEADESLDLGRGMARPYRIFITPEGEDHKSTRLVDDRVGSAGLWPKLPGMFFAFPVLRGKPAAQVLVEHNKPTTRDPAGRKPLIATHFVGAGRVLFCATDDTNRWKTLFETGYERYWVKGIRYLFEGRLSAGNSRLRITLSEEKIELGQPVKVVVDARTESYEPLVANEYRLRLTSESGEEQEFALQPVEGLPGQFQGFLRPTRTGYYQLLPLIETPGRPVQESLQVVPAAIEKEGPANLAELGALANVEGGQLLSRPSELPEAALAIEPGTRIETFKNAQAVWDSWVTIALLLSLLAVEWWLRKRSNLL